MSTQSSIEWTDTTWRAAKTAAKRLRVPLDEYVQRVSCGLKYCWRCRVWRSRAAFGADRSRGDGLASRCVTCRKKPKQLRLIRPTAAESERLRYASDPDYRFSRRQRVHARKRGVAAMPLEGRDALRERFGDRCAYCPETADTWDHIVPVAHGGRTIPGNVLPACRSCNSRKKDRDVFDFIDFAGIVVSRQLEEVLALAAEWGQL